MMKMMRTKISNNRPNFALAESKALEFIQKLETKVLPIKLIKYKDVFHDLEIKKYSWYAKKMGLTIAEVCRDLGSDDGCCVYNERNGKYRILYNDTIENEGRKRWTIAHELGHYALEHHKKHGCHIMKRSTITDEEYRAYEQEANCFARCLLAPPHIIFHIEGANPSIIQEVCNISLNAALNAFNFIKYGVKEYGIGYSKDSAEKLGFKDFLYSINNRFYCRSCECNFVLEQTVNCPHCGSDSIYKTVIKYGDDINMKYPGLEIDHKSRVKVCPRCENEDLDYDGNRCNICSTYLVNECSDEYEYDNFGNPDLIQKSCGTLLLGNSRYCHKCGNKSTFYNSRLLKDWTQKEEVEEEVKAEYLPF